MKKHFITLLLAVAAGLAVNGANTGVSQDMAQKINSKTYKVKDVEKYIRKEVTGSNGRITLISVNTSVVRGVSTFDKNVTDPNELFLFKHLQVKFGSQASEGTADIKEIDMKDAIPAQLQKAHLIVDIDGKNKFDLPLSLLKNPGVDQNILSSYFEISNDGSYFDMNKKIEINIEMPEGISVPTDKKHYVEVSFLGIGLQ